MRHAQLGIAPARALEVAERLVVVGLKQLEVAQVALDLGARHFEPGRLGVQQRLLIQLGGLAEVMLDAEHIRQAVVGIRQQRLVAQRREPAARGAIEPLGLGILVAAVKQVAEILLDLAGRQEVVVGQEHLARAQAALDRLVVAAEHRQRVDLTHLGGGGGVGLAKLLEACGCIVDQLNRALVLALDLERG